MEIKNLKRKETRKKGISIRTYSSYCEFMNKHDISPSTFFNEALKELIEKTERKK